MKSGNKSRSQIAAQVTPEEKERYLNFCNERGITLSQLLRWAVEEYIQNHQT